MSYVPYVTGVRIERAQVVVTPQRGRWIARLTAVRESFPGEGKSAVEAIESAIKAVKAEKRGAARGRAKNRYKVAQSLVARSLD
jgi:hypothetical protein